MKSLRFNINTGFLFLFKIFILTYTFIDLIRRFFDSSKVLLMSLDIIIVTTLFYFVATNKSKIRYINNVSIYLRVILFLFFIIILLQVFNPYYYDIKTYIVGFRSYLLAVPIILIGYHFSKYKLLLNKNMIDFIITLSTITVIYAIFQLNTDYTLLAGSGMEFIAPMEHGIHSHGNDIVQLTSSFFASSKKYGHFLMIMYLIYIGISLSLYKKVNIFIVILFIVALIVSGARESFALFILVNFVLIIKFLNIKWWNIFLVFSIFSLILFILFANDDLLLKIEFMFSTPDEYLRRIYMFFPFAFSDFSNPNMFFGLGVGKYGQETMLNPMLLDTTRGIDRVFFHDLGFFSSAYGFMDAGLAKVTIELGFLGISIYLIFIVYILYLAVKNIMYIGEDKLKLAFSLFIVLWVIYMMKAHPNISDISMSYFLFFSIGYISYKDKKYNDK
ncbi:MAG: hypothetical protein DRQ51_04230 [Gammaproteobacteria bacterium]|nr:MAG: hypothetical protein DRQ51_04230 [Gammaproteobacteria bacterium]